MFKWILFSVMIIFLLIFTKKVVNIFKELKSDG